MNVIFYLPWQIATSCLLYVLQIPGCTLETLGRGFKPSVEDLDSGQGYESGFEELSTDPRLTFL